MLSNIWFSITHAAMHFNTSLWSTGAGKPSCTTGFPSGSKPSWEVEWEAKKAVRDAQWAELWKLKWQRMYYQLPSCRF
jgi:hypothetical protein